ncbi:hypothetical protein BV25DRAFT_1911173 [Artomyces pyxidatus]|uniref:Uncharacterized protein n=1 Tax=Artomyces pyxidatus TaxID=48021 RepID=A0ACB8TIC3_9AGAM|nr:hypothetical protein BV25DRAFT_1911173 [Artomyces pyxidatus]
MSTVQTTLHVHFPAELARPPADRRRKKDLVYPKVAQSRDSSDRASSEDLYWGRRSVASPDLSEVVTAEDPLSDPLSPTLEPSTPTARQRAFSSFMKAFSVIDKVSGKPSPDPSQSPLFGLAFSPRSPRLAKQRIDPDAALPPLMEPTSSASSASSAQDSERDSVLRGRDAGHDAFIHVRSRSGSSDF